jgi:transposase
MMVQLKRVRGIIERHRYPSDITREQCELIRKELASARKETKPRKTDLYAIFCAMLYVVKSGCQWRMLPSDFPKWNNAYTRFQMWSEKKDGGGVFLSLF